MTDLIIEKIKQYNKIIIHGHCRPDGDCYGSQFGLKSIILNNFDNKEVYVVGEKAEFISFLGEMDEIDDKVFDGALSIVCDTPIKDRVSDQRFTLSKEVIKIDHHMAIEDFGSIAWVEDSNPACSQMIASLITKYNFKIDKAGAMALYVGIITDTGRFKYKNVNSKTLNIAATLLDNGLDVSYIDSLLSIETLDTIRLKGYILSIFKITENGFVYAVLDRKTIKKYGVTDEEGASMVNQLAGIKDCPVWALVIEYEDQIRIRIRSRGPRVDLLANMYNGGGHQMASGAGIDSFDELEKFVNDADELVKNYKGEIK